MCRVYAVTRAGYYAWRRREPSARSAADAALWRRIQRVHADSEGRYGSPRIQRVLCMQGVIAGKNRIARLMRQHRMCARAAKVHPRSRGVHRFFGQIPKQHLQGLSTRLNRVWVGDITYLKLSASWRYMATVMDRCSRRLIGWSVGPRRDARLTLKALEQAVQRRRPGAGLIFHSDRGTEYAGYSFRDRLAALGAVQSMNERVNDNAHMESFYHSLKSEAIHGRSFADDKQLRRVLSEYINFYNERRLHSSLGYVSPAVYERKLSRRGVN